MRKFWIIVGIVLSTLAVICLLNILIMAIQNGFSFGKVERTPENIRKQEKIELNEINSIKLNFKSADVKIMITDEPELKVIQYSNKELEEKDLFYTSVSNNELVVKENESNRIRILFFNTINIAYDIYIPKSYEGSIFAECVSGDIFIDEEIKLNNVEIKNTSGDIVFNKTINANELKIKTVSGDIKLNDVNSNRLILESTSGDINTGRITNNVEAKSTSGDIEITGSTGKISVETTSGNISIDNFTIKEKSNAKSVSGNIKINLNKDSNCKINTNTTSGNIKLPNGINVIGNEPYVDLDLKTTSGNIRID